MGTVDELLTIVESKLPGDEVTLTIERDEQRFTVPLRFDSDAPM